jgi:hypothetical protein
MTLHRWHDTNDTAQMMLHKWHCPQNIGVQSGVSNGVEDSHRLPALQMGHPWSTLKTVSGVARPQGIRPYKTLPMPLQDWRHPEFRSRFLQEEVNFSQSISSGRESTKSTSLWGPEFKFLYTFKEFQMKSRIHYSTFLEKEIQGFCSTNSIQGWSHDQVDAEWIVNRRQLWGHNDTPFGRPAPGRPSGRPGSGRPSGVFCIFSYF